MWEKRNLYRILVKKPVELDHLEEDFGVVEMMI